MRQARVTHACKILILQALISPAHVHPVLGALQYPAFLQRHPALLLEEVNPEPAGCIELDILEHSI